MKNLHKTLSNIALVGVLLAAAGCAKDHAPYRAGEEDRSEEGTRDAIDSDEAETDDPLASMARLSAAPMTTPDDDEADEPAADEPAADEPAADDDDAVTGSLHVLLTDAPAQYDHVWVEIAGVEIGTADSDAGGWITVMSEPRMIDLLTLQNDVTTILGDADLQPGFYSQLRMFVTSAQVVTGEVALPLFVPSAAQTGIKINLNFDVEAGVDYSLVLDFDALASIRSTGNGLHLSPVIKVESLTASTGAVMTPDGVDGGAVDTFTQTGFAADSGAPAVAMDAGAAAFDAGASDGG